MQTIQTIRFLLKTLLVFLALFTLFALAFFPISNLDTGLHIRTGEYIVSNWAVPKTNVFSEINASHRMVDDKWLFQVFTYLIYRSLGFGGLVAAKILLVGAIFLLLASIEFHRKHLLSSLLPVVACALIAYERFMFRPDLVSLLFLSIILWLLRKEQRGGGRRILYVIPLLYILWVNVHGYFFTGLVLLGLFWIPELASFLFRRRKKSSSRLRDYSIVMLLCLAGSFFNPNFHRGALFPLKTLLELWGSSKVLLARISEFLSPWDYFPNPINAILAYRIFVPAASVLLLLAFLLPFFTKGARQNKRSLPLPPAYILIYLTFLVMSFKLRRNIAQYALVSLPILSAALRELAAYASVFKQKSTRTALLSPILSVLLLLGLILLSLDIVSDRFHFRDRSKRVFGSGVSLISYPRAALQFVESANLKGNVFNDFGVGSYFVFHCYPERKPFIDGNTFGYSMDFYHNYARVISGETPHRDAAEQYGINYFFLRFASRTFGIITALAQDPGWKLVYFDGNCCIFLKDTPENRAVIQRFEIDLDGLSVKEIESRIRQVQPVGGTARSLSARAAKILSASTRYPSQLLNWAHFYFLLGKWERAEALYQIALMKNGELFEALISIAQIRVGRGNFEEGIELAKRGLAINPRYTEGYRVLAAIFLQQGMPERAAEACRSAIHLNPSSALFFFILGDCLYRMGEKDAAVESFEHSLMLELPENLRRKAHQFLDLLKKD